MLKNWFYKLIILFISAALSFGVFFTGFQMPVLAVSGEETAEEEIDSKHLQFVGRLYAVVTRQMHADEEEKLKLAKSLDDGIVALAHLPVTAQYLKIRKSASFPCDCRGSTSEYPD